MNITKTGGLTVVTGQTKLAGIHLEKTLASTAMGAVAQSAILPGRGMGHAVLPVFLNILVAGKTEFRLFLHQQPLLP